MADFALGGVALENALGWPEGSFLRAYAENRKDASDTAFDAQPIALAVAAFMAEQSEAWTGTASELLKLLRQSALMNNIDCSGKWWPQQPSFLSNLLRRAAPALRTRGIEVTLDERSTDRNRTRLIRLSSVGGDQ
jgi:hypothetical protein